MTSALINPPAASLLPSHWDPQAAADRVLGGLSNICQPVVKGAHDADFLIHDGIAYVVYMANEIKPGEHPSWAFIYDVLTLVEVHSGRVISTETFAATEKAYENESLPHGACFVPRIVQKDDRTLRLFFGSEDPNNRESQTWYLDFDLPSRKFDWNIYRAEIETPQGVFPMQPQHFYAQAAAEGFSNPSAPDKCGLWLIDSFKRFDGRVYAVMNHFSSGHLAWTELNPEFNRFKILGNLFRPLSAMMREASVNRMPDGSWLAIARQSNNDRNYLFSRSEDGRTWSQAEPWPLIPNGACSKPTFDCFDGVYYLGWQESTRINEVDRSVFNIDVSRDGVNWERKYRFATEESFQYPVFRRGEDGIYLIVTQGAKERISFGKLEPLSEE